ncbi:MAG: hypothetical protein ACW96U_06520, partial [Candidatus Heimdallarchaeaceae archaeon]
MSTYSFFRRNFSLLILVLIIGHASFSIDNVIGNPAVVTYYNFIVGGLIPQNQTHNLKILNADVTFEVQSNSDISIQFEGLYSIYNPNKTTEFTIAAPFSDLSANINETLTIEINGTVTSFILYKLTDVGLILWDDYFMGDYSRVFAVCNVSFEGRSNTEIRYTWKSVTSAFRDYMYFTYDVGTGRTWNGRINEKVEFQVKGIQPARIVDDPENDEEPRVQIKNHFIGK